MISPKSNGATSALAFSSAFLSFNPNYTFFKFRFLPYLFIPASYYFYEWNEYNSAYVNEICRPAHFTSILLGLLTGIIFRRM